MRALSLAALAATAASVAGQVTLGFDASKPLNTVDEIYLGYNIDTGSLYNGIDFTDPIFRAISAQLGPSIIRIGGTAVDYSYYHPEVQYMVGQINGANGNTVFSDSMLTQVIDYIQAIGFTLLWDFNGKDFRQNTVGPWMPQANATPMLDFIQSKYGGKVNFSWSLGNEPGLWPIKVPVSQLASDAATLKEVLKNYDLGQDVYGSSFESVNSGDAATYLPNTVGVIRGATFHNYPYARHCNISSYLDKTPVTQQLAGSLRSVANIARGVPGQDALLVLEETAGSYGGGCINITDRFASGFYYMPALSTVAASGFHRMHRQDIAGWSFAFGKSNYQLAGPPGWTNGTGLTPHADWFTSVLFKQLIGQVILNTTASGSSSLTDNLDVHVWCANRRIAPAGSAVLAWANMGGADVTIALPAALAGSKQLQYTMTSSASSYNAHVSRMSSGSPLKGSDYPPSLADDVAYLNGKLMTVDPTTGLLPAYPIPGQAGPASGSFSLPPYAYGFVVFPGAGLPACQ